MDRWIVQALQSTIQSSQLPITTLPKRMLTNHLFKVSKEQARSKIMNIKQKNLPKKKRIKNRTTTLLRRGADHYCLYHQSSQKKTAKDLTVQEHVDHGSQSKLVLNPSVAAKDSEVPGKDLDVKPSQEIPQTEHGSIAGASNEDRPNKRVETRNSSSHKPKDQKKKKKKRSRNSSRRPRSRSRSRSVSPHGRSGYRSEKKRKRKKRNRSRSRSTSKKSRRDSSKISRRSGGNKQVTKQNERREAMKEIQKLIKRILQRMNLVTCTE